MYWKSNMAKFKLKKATICVYLAVCLSWRRNGGLRTRSSLFPGGNAYPGGGG